MLKKIKDFFFEITQKEKKDRRSKFRFDVQYINDLNLKVEKSSLKMKEISLEGFSFYYDPKNKNQFKKGLKYNGIIKLKEREISINFEVRNKHAKLIGCQIFGGKEAYNRFVTEELSAFFISYL